MAKIKMQEGDTAEDLLLEEMELIGKTEWAVDAYEGRELSEECVDRIEQMASRLKTLVRMTQTEKKSQWALEEMEE